MARLKGRRILLVIGGGIAAYKALELIRLLRKDGAGVRAILTEGGSRFITPLSVASLTGDEVFTDLFSLKDETEMGHIRLSREADLVVVVPATANLLAKMAAGTADDLASTTLLATNKPVLVCPAMNTEMWMKPQTRRNLARLREDGIMVVDPDEGDLACGETGPGRLADVEDIKARIEKYFLERQGPLSGLKALVTAGPTLEPLDPVRFIGNRSSGKQGFAIAAALAGRGANTTLVAGPCNLETPPDVARLDVETADEMWNAVQESLPVDVAVCTAAVSDWRVKNRAGQKIKKTGSKTRTLEMIENPDILAGLSARTNRRPRLVVGFAAETENVLKNARAKLKNKKCDWIVANDVSAAKDVMGGDDNKVFVFEKNRKETWEKSTKLAIADRLVEKIARHFERQSA